MQSWMGDVSPVHSQTSFVSDISAIKNINKKDESTDDNDDKQLPGRFDLSTTEKIPNFILYLLVIIYFFRLELFQLFQ